MAAAGAAVVEPAALQCPITWQLMRDPVVNSLGNTYERAALERAWAAQPGPRKRDPLTNSRLASTALVPNQALRRQVQEFLDAHPGFLPDGWSSRALPPLPAVEDVSDGSDSSAMDDDDGDGDDEESDEEESESESDDGMEAEEEDEESESESESDDFVASDADNSAVEPQSGSDSESDDGDDSESESEEEGASAAARQGSTRRSQAGPQASAATLRRGATMVVPVSTAVRGAPRRYRRPYIAVPWLHIEVSPSQD